MNAGGMLSISILVVALYGARITFMAWQSENILEIINFRNSLFCSLIREAENARYFEAINCVHFLCAKCNAPHIAEPRQLTAHLSMYLGETGIHATAARGANSFCFISFCVFYFLLFFILRETVCVGGVHFLLLPCCCWVNVYFFSIPCVWSFLIYFSAIFVGIFLHPKS